MTDPNIPVKPPVVQPGSTNAILINPCQRLNPLLECIRNVNKEFGDITPDFQVGRTTGVLFLSLKYHRLHPEYIYQRIEKLGNMYTLRILLLMCDINEHQDPIREITKACVINNITIMVAWTTEEAGYYLSTFKSSEHKSPDLIKERVDKDFTSLYRTSLTSIAKINKTDVETLKSNIGSIADIASASAERMQLLPGLGVVKVRRIKEAFESPFHSVPSTNPPATTGRSPDSDKHNTTRQATTGLGLVLDDRLVSKQTSSRRPPSPVWDIELDLNPSDIEE